MTDHQLQAEAEAYATSIYPNPSPHDAPYVTSGELWWDLRTAYLAGRRKTIEEVNTLKKQVAAYKTLTEAGDKIRSHQSKLLSEAKTVDSEREMNAILTEENEKLMGLLKEAVEFGYDCGMSLTTPKREQAWQQFKQDNGL